MKSDQSNQTQAVWWRFGKEHGEDNFRVNSPSVVARHLNMKMASPFPKLHGHKPFADSLAGKSQRSYEPNHKALGVRTSLVSRQMSPPAKWLLLNQRFVNAYDPREVIEACWFPMEEAIQRLAFSNEKKMVRKAQEIIVVLSNT